MRCCKLTPKRSRTHPGESRLEPLQTPLLRLPGPVKTSYFELCLCPALYAGPRFCKAFRTVTVLSNNSIRRQSVLVAAGQQTFSRVQIPRYGKSELLVLPTAEFPEPDFGTAP
jgi:hypothetical protein